ncbi:MAG: hypothetical protein HRS50_00590 [Mycoplasmataceae bacterium]|nr:hypothetical protein [Mycoplasmataceae bacterium]
MPKTFKNFYLLIYIEDKLREVITLITKKILNYINSYKIKGFDSNLNLEQKIRKVDKKIID